MGWPELEFRVARELHTSRFVTQRQAQLSDASSAARRDSLRDRSSPEGGGKDDPPEAETVLVLKLACLSAGRRPNFMGDTSTPTPEPDEPMLSCRGAPGLVRARLRSLGRDNGRAAFPNPPAPSPTKWSRSPDPNLPAATSLPAPSPAPKAEPMKPAAIQIQVEPTTATAVRAPPRQPAHPAALRKMMTIALPERCRTRSTEAEEQTPDWTVSLPEPLNTDRPSPTKFAPVDDAAAGNTPPSPLKRQNSAPLERGRWTTVRTLVHSETSGSLATASSYSLLSDDESAPEPPPVRPTMLRDARGSSFKSADTASSGGGFSLTGFNLTELADEAMRSKVHLVEEQRQEMRDTEETANQWFLSDKLIMREISRRRGSTSWQSHLVTFLHSPRLAFSLVLLLLIDVMIIFVELFLEGTFPPCEIITRDATSCCPALASALPADHHHLRVLSGHGHEDDHQFTCGAGFAMAPAGGVYCDPHLHAKVHHAETIFTLMTVIILMIFLFELIGLLLALDRLFFKSPLHILDLFIVTFSLGLQIHIYIVRVHGDQVDDGTMADPHGEAILPDDITGLILFSRCWRFVRVGHGIATSITDMVRAKQFEIHTTVEELKKALRQIESENHDRNKELRDGTANGGELPKKMVRGGAMKALPKRGSMRMLLPTKKGDTGKEIEEPMDGLHYAHSILAKLAQQSAY